MRSDAFLVSIAAELAAHSVVRSDGPHGSKSPLPFGPQAIRIAADGRPHREQRNDLQHMVLHHIADYTHLLVETSSALYTQSLDVEVSMPDHCLECRKDLLRRQIAGGTKKHKRIRFEIRHFQPLFLVPISQCFSKCLRSHPSSSTIYCKERQSAVKN